MNRHAGNAPRAGLITLLLIVLSISSPVQAEPPGNRFFLMGDGKIHIRSDRTGDEATVTLVTADGRLNDDGFTRIDAVFEFPTRDKGEHISPRLLFMLDYFSDLVAPGRMITLESGYRSPEYNRKLSNQGGIVAKTSLHMDGMALDFSIQGVDGKTLWDLIRSRDCCGVGHYGGKTIHLDSARPRFWEADTAGVTSGDSDYNRRIHLSTDYDRYRAGDRVRLSFSSVSDFGFGVAPSVAFVNDAEGLHAVQTARSESGEAETDCRMIENRKASRFLYVIIPSELPAGRYRIRVNFCRQPFPQMPANRISNEIEIL
ncbi:MAG: DUF882 domain-containing protein [Pseudomonadota bacterium]